MAVEPTIQQTRSDPLTDRDPSVLAIVVTHRGREWFKDCLVGLNIQNYRLLDVLVVDDASPDYRDKPTLKRIAKRHLRKRRWGYLRTPRPLGFGGAINWALSRVRTDADLLLFIHDDAALEKGSVRAMVERMFADEKTAIVGPKIVAWDDPTKLEEVGMAVDRFGYPYKGLESEEIDLGQHDSPNEVFYVTTTCFLMKHEVFKELRGWDSHMRAFSEDLDLCWRARLAGHSVRVEPRAKARHVIALAKGLRESRYTPQRYYIRRNRLRTITKNASGLRLIGLIPAFVLLALVEMLAFVVLRQPREILNLGRALGWNLLTLPQTFAERRRVQKTRQVSDRQLGRLIVRQSARIRFYVAHQADRLEEAWGRRAEVLSERVSQVKSVGSLFSGRWGLVALLLIVLAAVGFRHLLWGPSYSVGELLPYPESTSGLVRAFASPWQGAGLGQPAPGPPAFLFLGIFPIITLGAVGAAQKLLVVALGIIAGIGAYRLLDELADRRARIIAAVIYVLGPVGYVGVREGALGALVLGAMAPFVIHSLLKLTGWVRPPAWDGGRELARTALAAATAAAFVPGALFIFAILAVVLALARALFVPQAFRSISGSLVALLVAWALLLPWSASWFSAGGPINRLTSEADVYAAGFADHGALSVLLGQTPDGPALFGLALPILGIVAAMTAEGQRRRTALALWAVIATVAALVALIRAGIIPPILASPTEAGAISVAAFAGLAGLAVSAFRVDLPRRGFGVVQAATVGGLAIAMFFTFAGGVPALWKGEWSPGGETGRRQSEVVDQIRSLLAAEAEAAGQFRVLWVGDVWASRGSSAAFSPTIHQISGSRGRVVNDLFDRASGVAQRDFQRVVASIEEKTTDRGGALLGTFNVRYIVLDNEPETVRPWLAQRDLAVDRSEAEYILLKNSSMLARAAVYNEVPVYVQAVRRSDPRLSSADPEVERLIADQSSSWRYEAPKANGPGIVFLAETRDRGWVADIGDVRLQPVSAGWANAFEIPEGANGPLRVAFPRDLTRTVFLFALLLAWIVVIGAAVSKRKTRTRVLS